MFPARSGKSIKLTHLLSNELYKKVLSVNIVFPMLSYIENIISTSKCRNGTSYGLHTNMEIVSYVSSCPQLGLVKVDMTPFQ